MTFTERELQLKQGDDFSRLLERRFRVGETLVVITQREIDEGKQIFRQSIVPDYAKHLMSKGVTRETVGLEIELVGATITRSALDILNHEPSSRRALVKFARAFDFRFGIKLALARISEIQNPTDIPQIIQKTLEEIKEDNPKNPQDFIKEWVEEGIKGVGEIFRAVGYRLQP